MLEAQNKVLMDQVAQMQQMLAQQQMMMSSFMAKFPVPLDEPERLLSLDRSELMSMLPGSKPLEPIDRIVRELSLDKQLVTEGVIAIMLNILDSQWQKALSYAIRPPGAFHFLMPNDVSEGVRGQVGAPRKLTSCQYVVSTGELFCHKREELDPLSQVPALADVDPKVAEMLAPGGMMDVLQDTSKAGPDAPIFDAIGAIFNSQYTYSGAPVTYEGHVMGAICMMGTQPKPTAAEQAQLGEYGKRITELFDKIIR